MTSRPPGLEGIKETLHAERLGPVIPGVHVKERDQVPAAVAQVEVIEAIDDGVQFHSQLRGAFFGLPDGDVRKVDASGLPALLGQINGVPSFAHTEVDGEAGFAVTHGIDEQAAGLVMEGGFGAAEFFVPEIAIAGIDVLSAAEEREEAESEVRRIVDAGGP